MCMANFGGQQTIRRLIERGEDSLTCLPLCCPSSDLMDCQNRLPCLCLRPPRHITNTIRPPVGQGQSAPQQTCSPLRAFPGFCQGHLQRRDRTRWTNCGGERWCQQCCSQRDVAHFRSRRAREAFSEGETMSVYSFAVRDSNMIDN